MATLGVAFPVQLQITQGRATKIQIGMTGPPTGVPPLSGTVFTTLTVVSGIEFMNASMFVVPLQKGTFRLDAWAFDGCGNQDQTGIVRQVTVQ